jgi:hypothetical protein
MAFFKDIADKLMESRQRIVKAFSKRPKTSVVKRSIRSQSNPYDYYSNSMTNTSVYDVENLYRILGYPSSIAYTDYEQKYNRQDVANRVVKAPVLGCWRYDPTIYDVKGKDTAFNTAVLKLEKDKDLFVHLSKADLLGALGQYSILYLGLNDTIDPVLPATKATEVLYFAPIPENRAAMQTYEDDITSPRYGAPTSYTITINEDVVDSTTQSVNYTRVIHIAQDTLDNNYKGIPVLRAIFNNLIGLETLSLCSPVMFKSGSRPGNVIQPDDSGIITDAIINDAKQQIQTYLNDTPNLPRFLYLQGMKTTPLPVQVVSPMDHVKVQLKLISAATRIPLRILTGSERGELASNQDERTWLNYLEERRLNISEKLILRPTVDRLIELGVIPEPQGGEYNVEWPPLIVNSEMEMVEISFKKAQTVYTRNGAVGGEEVYTNDMMYKDWGKTDEEIEGEKEKYNDMMKEDGRQEIQEEKQEDGNEKEKES